MLKSYIPHTNAYCLPPDVRKHTDAALRIKSFLCHKLTWIPWMAGMPLWGLGLVVTTLGVLHFNSWLWLNLYLITQNHDLNATSHAHWLQVHFCRLKLELNDRRNVIFLHTLMHGDYSRCVWHSFLSVIKVTVCSFFVVVFRKTDNSRYAEVVELHGNWLDTLWRCCFSGVSSFHFPFLKSRLRTQA